MSWRIAKTGVVLLALVALLESALAWRHPLLRTVTWDVIQMEAGKLFESLR